MKSIHTIAYALLVLTLPVAFLVVAPFVTETNAQWDYSTDYTSGFGDFGYTSYDSGLYASDSLWDYSFGNTSSFGDYGYSAYNYDSYNSYNSWDYSLDNTGSFGDIGYGCCDEYVYSSADSWDYSLDNTGSFGDIGYGCCESDTLTQAPAPIVGGAVTPVPPQQTYYGQPSPYNYYPTTYAYANDMYSYAYPSYQSYGYSYPTYTYSAGSYTYTPVTYTPVIPTGSRPTCALTASDNTIDEDEDTTLRWTTTNATSVYINNGIGSVARTGSRTVSPNDTVTYTLTAYNSYGSVTCSETIRVDEDEEEEGEEDVSCDSFTASDTTVDDGDYVTLRWRTTNADEVSINQGIGDVPEDGDERVRITRDTTFTLTAENDDDTDTCRVTVRIDEDDDDDNDRIAPRCVFHVSDTEAYVGQNLVFSWENERTDRLVLTDGDGREIVDTDGTNRVNEDRGGINILATKSMTYTLTVYNGNIHRTCTLHVTVEGNQTNGISLSQVPYTGFEAGPLLTTIFYTAIVLWGLVLAYVLVVRKTDVKKKSVRATYQG